MDALQQSVAVVQAGDHQSNDQSLTHSPRDVGSDGCNATEVEVALPADSANLAHHWEMALYSERSPLMRAAIK